MYFERLFREPESGPGDFGIGNQCSVPNSSTHGTV